MDFSVFRSSLAGAAAILLTSCAARDFSLTPIAPSSLGTATSIVPLDTSPDVLAGGACVNGDVPHQRRPLEFGADLDALGPNARNQSTMVGFTVWTATDPGCADGVKTMFRGHAGFDLAPIAGPTRPGDPYARTLDRVVLALVLETHGGETSAPGPFVCPASTGGLAAVFRLLPGAVIENGFHGPNTEFGVFPATDQAPLQDLRGMVAGETRDRAHASSSSAGTLSIEIDVTKEVKEAIDRGDAQIGFALAGADEFGRIQAGNSIFVALNLPQDVQFDCRAMVRTIALIATGA